MKLVVDCGNTDTVFAIYKGLELMHHWRMSSSEEFEVKDWSYHIASELFEQRVATNNIHQAIISSVVPELTPIITESLEKIINTPPLVVNAGIYDQLNIKIINTVEIGTDLVANAVAAYHYSQQACIIVDFGTALTFTAINQAGVLSGVAIAPGLQTAVKSLLQHTAQLPEVPLKMPPSVLGMTTSEAIQSGVLVGYSGLVRHLIARIKKELGEKVQVFATGGLCHVLDNVEDCFDRKEKHLTLEGLALIGDNVANK